MGEASGLLSNRIRSWIDIDIFAESALTELKDSVTIAVQQQK
jgi:hypothetical protein